MDTLKTLQQAVIEFGKARNWTQYHSPKNISMAITVEASELMEIFQWHTEEESRQLNEEDKEKAALEIADIFMYTLISAQQLGIDLEHYTKKKMAINEKRFPIPSTL